MTTGISKDISASCMTMFLSITTSYIIPKVAISLVIADGHFNLPQRFVCAYMGKHTDFVILRVYLIRMGCKCRVFHY